MALLEGKVAVITGGTRGIGLAVARRLVDDGASVVISGTDAGRAARAAADLGPRALGVQADVRSSREVEQLIDAAVTRFGGLDILINNAGIGTFGPVSEMSLESWHDVLETNLTGVFNGCKAALPRLRARGGGWIINVSSLAGKNPFSGGAAYCASKAALNAFSESLMQEVRHDGIRVAYVLPGSVRTEFGRARSDAPASPAAGDDWKLAPEDVADVITGLLVHPARSLPSRVEIRPAQPPTKG